MPKFTLAEELVRALLHEQPDVVRKALTAEEAARASSSQRLLFPDQQGLLEHPVGMDETVLDRPFYSKLQASIPNLPAKAATGKKMRELLSAQGVKKEEIETMRLDSLLSRPGPVTRDEVANHVAQVPFRVETYRFSEGEGANVIGPNQEDRARLHTAVIRAHSDQATFQRGALGKVEGLLDEIQAANGGVLPRTLDYYRGTRDVLGATRFLEEINDPAVSHNYSFLKPEQMRSIAERANGIRVQAQAHSDAIDRALTAYNATEAPGSKYQMMQLVDGPSGHPDYTTAAQTVAETVLRVNPAYTETGESAKFHDYPSNPLVLIRSTQRPMLADDGSEAMLGTTRFADQIQSDLHQRARNPTHGGTPRTERSEMYYPTQKREPPQELQDRYFAAEEASVEAQSRYDANVVDQRRLMQRAQAATDPAEQERLMADQDRLRVAGLSARQDAAAARAALADAERALAEYENPASAGDRRQPDLPFKSSNEWGALAVKQLLADAIRSGQDAISIPSGRYQAMGQNALATIGDLEYHGGDQFLNEHGESFDIDQLKEMIPHYADELDRLKAGYDETMEQGILDKLGEQWDESATYTSEPMEDGTFAVFENGQEFASGFRSLEEADQAIMGFRDEEIARARANLRMRDEERMMSEIRDDMDPKDYYIGLGDEEVFTNANARGLAKFYDDTMPNVLAKTVRKIDPEAQVEYLPIDFGGEFDDVAPTVRITDKMREIYKTKGFELFGVPLAMAASMGLLGGSDEADAAPLTMPWRRPLSPDRLAPYLSGAGPHLAGAESSVLIPGSGYLSFNMNEELAREAEKLALQRGQRIPGAYQPLNTERGTRIADTFENWPRDWQGNKDAQQGYLALKDETLNQYDNLRALGFEHYLNPPGFDPYGNPRWAVDDANVNRRLHTFPTSEGYGSDATRQGVPNPLEEWVPGMTDSAGRPIQVNDAFRFIHDLMGHAAGGVGFRAGGEDNAFLWHAPTFSPLARRAAASELRGQNSALNFGQYGEHNRQANPAPYDPETNPNGTIYSDQKFAAMPRWVAEEGRDTDRTRAFQARLAARETGLEGAIDPKTGLVKLEHWSTQPLEWSDPDTYGTGHSRFNRAERNRRTPAWVNRTYFGIPSDRNPYRKETPLWQVKHEALIPGSQLYPAHLDPEGVIARNAGDFTAAERELADTNWSGLYNPVSGSGNFAAIFDPLRLKKLSMAGTAGAAALLGLSPEEADAAEAQGMKGIEPIAPSIGYLDPEQRQALRAAEYRDTAIAEPPAHPFLLQGADLLRAGPRLPGNGGGWNPMDWAAEGYERAAYDKDRNPAVAMLGEGYAKEMLGTLGFVQPEVGPIGPVLSAGAWNAGSEAAGTMLGSDVGQGAVARTAQRYPGLVEILKWLSQDEEPMLWAPPR